MHPLPPPVHPGVSVSALKCENVRNPLGIDAPQPRLNWILTSGERGQRQSAYRVLVASSLALLTRDRGDLWDTGKVTSNRSIQVEYAGRPLTSGDHCYWKVRVWDRVGQPSTWSAPASWSIGLLKPADWRASWITFTPSAFNADSAGGAVTLDGAHWIWFSEGAARVRVPAGVRYFRRTFTLPVGAVSRIARGI